nr:hypothetical protein [Solirubrobacterales bacterium]
MERDDQLGRSSQQGELGPSGGVDDAAWEIDWDLTRPARLVGGRDRHRANGVAALEPPAARPHAPPPVADPIPAADRTPVP